MSVRMRRVVAKLLVFGWSQRDNDNVAEVQGLGGQRDSDSIRTTGAKKIILSY